MAATKYADILEAAGYNLYQRRVISNTSCWIKDGAEDINVDEVTGLWAAEHDEAGFGRDAVTITDYLKSITPDPLEDFNYVGSRHHY